MDRVEMLKSKNKTNYTVIELFAGAGGMALGFKNAGLNHLLFNEVDRNAVETLKLNFGQHENIVHADIREVDFKKFKGEVDVVQGGFPCQSFSVLGKRRGFEETRGTLFFELLRCIDETKPKIAVGENVKGLQWHDKGKTLQIMCDALEEVGYRVQYKVLKAKYFDVPQKRERLIIVGIRKDLTIPYQFPKENPYTISLKVALKDCPESVGESYSPRKKEMLSRVPEGGCWRDLPFKMQKAYIGKNFDKKGGGGTGMARRLSWREPCLTLLCSPSGRLTERCHPEETRPFTVREYARIQTFPDHWQFAGSRTSQYKQIGNAVPVNLGFHLGNSIINSLDSVCL